MFKTFLFKNYLLGCILILQFMATSKIKAQTSYQVQSAKVDFIIKNAGFNVDGSFKGLEASISFDAQTGNGSIEASIDVSTINTGINARDKHLRSDDYFDVVKYPKIKMKSTKIEKQKDGSFIGTFNLTIKSTTKSIKLPFTFQNNTFVGKFTINRQDYGVGKGSWVLSDNATITLTVKVD
jgi:polyisoprenoid-binding protein YceI